MTPAEETLADLWATSTYGTHPVAHIRAALDARQVLTAAAARSADDGAVVAVAGLVTHRQRPPTARGVVFLSLEDETGMVNVICPPRCGNGTSRPPRWRPPCSSGAGSSGPAAPSTWSRARCARSGSPLPPPARTVPAHQPGLPG